MTASGLTPAPAPVIEKEKDISPPPVKRSRPVYASAARAKSRNALPPLERAPGNGYGDSHASADASSSNSANDERAQYELDRSTFENDRTTFERDRRAYEQGYSYNYSSRSEYSRSAVVPAQAPPRLSRDDIWVDGYGKEYAVASPYSSYYRGPLPPSPAGAADDRARASVWHGYNSRDGLPNGY